MGLNPLLLLLASILLLTSRVSSKDEELILAEAVNTKTPAASSPVEEPTPVAPTSPHPPVHAFPPLPYIPVTPPHLDCNLLCAGRCKLHPRKKLCMRACNTCCERCKCVPPGTYGNKEKCGKCYTEAKPECP